MEDIMLIKLLKEKGILNDHEYSELNPNKESKIMEDASNQHIDSTRADKYSEFFGNFKEVTENMNQSEKHQFVDRLKEYDNKSVEHFNEAYSKYVVSKMWHINLEGKKCSGEVYDMYKAKEVRERYRGVIPTSITDADVYVAINSQYHNYHCLFTKWFGNNIDFQIIESAMIYWFKDDDSSPSKLWDNFG